MTVAPASLLESRIAMRLLRVSAFVSIAALVAAAAFAYSVGPASDPKPNPSSASASNPEPGQAPTARQEAERWYGDAYNEIAKGNKDLADDKGKNAEKRFKKAMERGEKAVALDSVYYEAYNLIGYCARQLRVYDKSLAAYKKSLAIRPDYAPAREYLGELYVDMGDLDKAREQLAWLEKLEDTEAVATLTARIMAKASGGSGTMTAPAPAAAADTLRTGSGGSQR
jgi:tetratricopeptide (TPR) repeat protein